MSHLRQDFKDDHARLARVFDELLNAVESDDSPTIQRAWNGFESGLVQHLVAEERYLFPPLERRHGAEIAELREEHARIRELVARLGIDADLHLLRKDVAEQLVALLRQHAQREDETLYEWAEEELEEGLLSKLKNRLGRVDRDAASGEAESTDTLPR